MRPAGLGDFDSAYQGAPPWDVGHPQAAFLRVAEAGAIGGRGGAPRRGAARARTRSGKGSRAGGGSSPWSPRPSSSPSAGRARRPGWRPSRAREPVGVFGYATPPVIRWGAGSLAEVGGELSRLGATRFAL